MRGVLEHGRMLFLFRGDKLAAIASAQHLLVELASAPERSGDIVVP